MMRRTILVVLAVALFVLRFPPVVVLAVGCEDCQPARIGANTSMSGQYTVCIQSDSNNQFSSAEASAIETGIQHYWGGYLSTASSIGFAISTGTAADPCSGDITISIDPSLRTANNGNGDWADTDPSGGDGRGSTIRVNPDFLGQTFATANWEWLGAHEMGHVLDFNDITNDACQAYSIMAHGNQNYDPDDEFLRCADALACSLRWTQSNLDDGANQSQPNEDNCFDVYYVQVQFCWNGQHWILCGQVWTWLYEDCDPIPEG
jgi:hypothetical protein